jgi:hypothetical protein
MAAPKSGRFPKDSETRLDSLIGGGSKGFCAVEVKKSAGLMMEKTLSFRMISFYAAFIVGLWFVTTITVVSFNSYATLRIARWTLILVLTSLIRLATSSIRSSLG